MKVSIIGASTAGLFTAFLLAKEGVEVEVYEMASALGWPPRTLIVTRKITQVLDFVPQEAIVNRIKYFELFSKTRSAKIELGTPDLVIERGKLIKMLGSLADGVGAKIMLGHQFEGFTRNGRRIVLSLKNLAANEEKRIETDVLIGADGVGSAVCQAALGNGHRLSALIQARVLFPENVDHDTVKVWFDPQKTKYFYWLIPESSRAAAVGLIADNAQKAETCLRMFLQEKQFVDSPEVQRALVPVHPFKYADCDLISRQNIFVLGDAAGHVKVTTVGGLVSGLNGARALTKALLNGGNIRREFGRLNSELNLHALVRKVLNKFGDDHYDELITMLQGELKEVLEKWTRDELRQSYFKLILSEPRLITLGMKALLRTKAWS